MQDDLMVDYEIDPKLEALEEEAIYAVERATAAVAGGKAYDKIVNWIFAAMAGGETDFSQVVGKVMEAAGAVAGNFNTFFYF